MFLVQAIPSLTVRVYARYVLKIPIPFPNPHQSMTVFVKMDSRKKVINASHVYLDLMRIRMVNVKFVPKIPFPLTDRNVLNVLIILSHFLNRRQSKTVFVVMDTNERMMNVYRARLDRKVINKEVVNYAKKIPTHRRTI